MPLVANTPLCHRLCKSQACAAEPVMPPVEDIEGPERHVQESGAC